MLGLRHQTEDQTMKKRRRIRELLQQLDSKANIPCHYIRTALFMMKSNQIWMKLEQRMKHCWSKSILIRISCRWTKLRKSCLTQVSHHNLRSGSGKNPLNPKSCLLIWLSMKNDFSWLRINLKLHRLKQLILRAGTWMEISLQSNNRIIFNQPMPP